MSSTGGNFELVEKRFDLSRLKMLVKVIQMVYIFKLSSIIQLGAVLALMQLSACSLILPDTERKTPISSGGGTGAASPVSGQAASVNTSDQNFQKPRIHVYPGEVHLSALQNVEDICIMRLDFYDTVDAIAEDPEQVKRYQAHPKSMEELKHRSEELYNNMRARIFMTPHKDWETAIKNEFVELNPSSSQRNHAVITLEDIPQTVQYLYVRYETDSDNFSLSKYSHRVTLPVCHKIYTKNEQDDSYTFDSDALIELKKYVSCPSRPKYVKKNDFNVHFEGSDYQVNTNDFLGAMYDCNNDYKDCHIERRYLPKDSLSPAVKFTLTQRTEFLRERISEVINHYNEIAEELKITQPGQNLVELEDETKNYFLTCWINFIDLVPQSSGYLSQFHGAAFFSRLSESGQIINADIISNTNEIFNENGEAFQNALRKHYSHEIGHALGMDHNFASRQHSEPSVMDYLTRDEALDNNGILTAYDKAVLRYLYTDSQNPEDFYNPNGEPWVLLRKKKENDPK